MQLQRQAPAVGREEVAQMGYFPQAQLLEHWRNKLLQREEVRQKDPSMLPLRVQVGQLIRCSNVAVDIIAQCILLVVQEDLVHCAAAQNLFTEGDGLPSAAAAGGTSRRAG